MRRSLARAWSIISGGVVELASLSSGSNLCADATEEEIELQ